MELKKDKLRLLRSRDKDTFETLVREHQENVYRIVFSILNNEQSAQDVAQEVFIRIYRQISSFRGNAALSTWIYRIAYNTALEFCKTPDRRATPEGYIPELMYLMDARNASVEIKRSEAEIRSDVSEALSMLPDEQRQVVMLRDVYGFSAEQVSSMSGVKSGTLKSRLSRGRSGVKNILIKKWGR